MFFQKLFQILLILRIFLKLEIFSKSEKQKEVGKNTQRERLLCFLEQRLHHSSGEAPYV